MNVLVTGGTGFIGSQLVAALVEHGHSVRVLRRANSSLIALEGLRVEHVVGDILDIDVATRAATGCDLAFHVAAISSYWRARREQIYHVNVEGTRTVMEACRRAGVPRVVHTSSVGAIGLPTDNTPADETLEFDTLSASIPYLDSKHRAELEVHRAIDRGLDAVIVNPAVVIGPGDHYLISSSMVVELARHPLPAVPPGGTCVASIAAVVQGHLAAAEKGRVGERYILGGENLSFRQIAAMIASVSGHSGPRHTIPRWLLPPAGAVVEAYNRLSRRPPVVNGQQIRISARNLYYDSTKAARELNYPLLPVNDAIKQAYIWYKSHGYLT